MGVTTRVRHIFALAVLNGFLLVLAPFIVLKKIHRYSRKRHPHELDWRRWTIPSMVPDRSLAPKSGKRVVMVGPTYGELRIMEVVTRKLEQARPDINVIWCLRDLATINLVKQAHPERDVVIWPFENAFPVWKWVRQVQPDVVVITEKFWLPNLISVCRLAGAKIAVINARTNRRDRFADKVKFPYYSWMTHSIDVFCLQAPLFLERLNGLLKPTTAAVVTGNIKLDLEAAPLDEHRTTAIAQWLSTTGDLPLLAAGSTGPDVDEDFVFAAFKQVREKVPCCLLIAPRKTHRAPGTAEDAAGMGYKVSLRSASSKSQADVYVLDTLGELSHAYRYARAAFIGGTVVSTGHNVMEPVLWGIPVSYGPLRGHFEDLQLLCEEFGVGFRCRTPEDLAEHWLRALTDPSFQAEIRDRAERLTGEKKGATEATVRALFQLVD